MFSPTINIRYLESRKLALQSPFKKSETPHGKAYLHLLY